MIIVRENPDSYNMLRGFSGEEQKQLKDYLGRMLRNLLEEEES